MSALPHRQGRARAAIEVADVFLTHGAAYRAKHRLIPQQYRVMRAIETCRTRATGGHAFRCEACGAVRLAYNSCRNRHCPKCQTLAKERWLGQRRAELLPVPYFHVVFTLPHELNALAQGNPRVIYALLFQAASATLLEFGRNPRWLGGELGATLVLHTWGQNLTQHLHVHGVVTGGALGEDGQWRAAKRGFLFPVKALSQVFRGKYLAALQRAFERAALKFAGHTAQLAKPAAWRTFLTALKAKDWVVYAKRPFAGPEQVLDYLGRYTHRVAISNHRLVSFKEDQVRFRWRDYAHGNQRKVMALDAHEFIRRFLLHVLPKGFMRIRHYGLTANRSRRAALPRARQALDCPLPAPLPVETVEALLLRVLRFDIHLCPRCKVGRLKLVGPIEAHSARSPPHATGPPRTR